MPKSFQVHVMALGGVVRGEHKTYVVVSFPGERPPTENLHQVHECNIFKHIQKRGTCVFSDGNMAWRSVCYKNNIRNQEVVHQVKEFTRSVQHGKKNLSTLAGTQCVDRTWRTLKHYLPKKKLMKDPHTKSLCPFFEHQVYAWAWRKNLGQLSAKIFLRQLTKIWQTAQ